MHYLVSVVAGLFLIVKVHAREDETTLIVDLTLRGNETRSKERYCVLQPQREKGSWELVQKNNGEDTGFGLKFACAEGYTLSRSDPYSSCEEFWDVSKTPKCDKLCPRMSSTFSTTLKCFDKHNQKIDCDKATEGSYLKYTCAGFYEPPSGYNTTIYCSGGNWSVPDTICQPICGRNRNLVRELRSTHYWISSDTKYPWIAALFGKVYSDDIMFLCGLTVISEKLVLGAAHCVTTNSGDVLPEKYYQVAAGVLYRNYKDPRDEKAQYLDVFRIIVHPRYKGDLLNYQHDLSIIVTKQRFTFNEVVQPVCFTGVNDIPLKVGEDFGVVSGWSIITPFTGQGPFERQKTIKFPHKSSKTCLDELPVDFAKRFLLAGKFCAGQYNRSTSLCRGDGGAGLMFENEEDNKFYIHGIASLVRTDRGECDIQQNAIYTNLSFYYDFIQEQLQEYTVKDCRLPAHPGNGRWIMKLKNKNAGDVVPPDTQLKFVCDPGYKLSSDNADIKCHSLYLIPTCDKLCPAPNITSTVIAKCFDKNHRRIDCADATHGSSLSYKCIPLHEFPIGYEPTIFCEDGKWNSPGPVCNPICGKKVNDDVIPLIHGGQSFKVVEYPWIVAVYQKTGEGYKNICGGTILSQRVVLTAAHCVTNSYGDGLAAENHLVAGGKLYNEYQDSRDPSPQYLEIFRIIPHSSYKGTSRHYLADIAILITKQAFAFNFFVHPVCFEGVQNMKLKIGDVGVVTGWGNTEDGDPSDELKVLEIPYKHQYVCSKELPHDWADRYNLIDKLCVGLYNQNKSLCSGDSGGGLFYRNEDNRYYLHGVVSLGHALRGECNFQQNSLYTNVDFHYDFINREFTNYHLKECTLPPYPENGKWAIKNDTRGPGDMALSETVLDITCNEGFKLSSDNSKIKCESAFLMPICQNASIPIVVKDATRGTNIKITCVYDSKMNNEVKPDALNTTLCTHLLYNSVGLTQEGGIKIPRSVSEKGLKSFVASLKKTNQHLKVLVSVYGTGDKEIDEYPTVASTTTLRRTFIDNVINFLEKYNFDGLNIHWDVPLIKDMENYGSLIKQLRKKLKPEWLLTATVHYSPINLGYNHIEMYNNLDWFNVECYGLYGGWSLYTGQNAALYPSSVENDFERKTYNLQQCTENWLQYSYKDKLSPGVAFFGRYYTLTNESHHGLHAPVTGNTDSSHTGLVTYADICQKYNNWTRVWDDEQKTPYKYHKTRWVGYDDTDSIELKAAFIKDMGCFGVTVSPINGDDVAGICGPKQTLLKHLHDGILGNLDKTATVT